MKRHIIISLFLVAALSAWAQPRLRQPEMYIGAHGGVLFSIMRFTPDVEGGRGIKDKTLLSGNGGLIFRYGGHKHCAVQVELNYMQRGWRENADKLTDVEEGSVHYKRKLDFLEMPFLAHIHFGKKVRFFINLGPQIGVCVHESWSGTKHPIQQEQYQSLDRIFDWGVTGGLGLLVRTSKAGVFQVEGRFGYSFGDYFSNHKSDYFSSSNPMCLSVNVGYLWEIKPKQRATVK